MAFVDEHRQPDVVFRGVSDRASCAKLASLADCADYSGARVPPDGIILNGDRFQGILNIIVLLRYAPPGEEPSTDSWTFPAEFAGRFRDGEVAIETIDVDTRSFFAGEEYADADG